MERRGCNEEQAREHLGCSLTLFAELKARKIVVPLRRGWYSYRLLGVAMDQLEAAVLRTRGPLEESAPRAPGKKQEITTELLLARMQPNAERKTA